MSPGPPCPSWLVLLLEHHPESRGDLLRAAPLAAAGAQPGAIHRDRHRHQLAAGDQKAHLVEPGHRLSPLARARLRCCRRPALLFPAAVALVYGIAGSSGCARGGRSHGGVGSGAHFSSFTAAVLLLKEVTGSLRLDGGVTFSVMPPAARLRMPSRAMHQWSTVCALHVSSGR